MYIKEKDHGYVLLQTSVILLLVSLISILISKTVIRNMNKSKVYSITKDIRSLSEEDEKLLYLGSEYINSKEKIIKRLVEKENNISMGVPTKVFSFEYKFHENRNKRIIINNEKIFIQEQGDLGKRYIDLEYELQYEENKETPYVVIFPGVYKTGFILRVLDEKLIYEN